MKAKGKIRIIGGQHRGRKVSIVDNVIKPTKDRVRETLFNWLALQTEGNRCLDLFAGTGILGIEALSRGASEVAFVFSVSSLPSAPFVWGALRFIFLVLIRVIRV